jgi:hypothetical protein
MLRKVHYEIREIDAAVVIPLLPISRHGHVYLNSKQGIETYLFCRNNTERNMLLYHSFCWPCICGMSCVHDCIWRSLVTLLTMNTLCTLQVRACFISPSSVEYRTMCSFAGRSL